MPLRSLGLGPDGCLRAASPHLQFLQAMADLSTALKGTLPGPALLNPGMEVMVLLGPSSQRPREIYHLLLQSSAEGTAPLGAPPVPSSSPSPKQQRDAVRRMLQALVMQHAAIEEWDTCPRECSQEGSQKCLPFRGG